MKRSYILLSRSFINFPAHYRPTIEVGRFVVDALGCGWSDLPQRSRQKARQRTSGADEIATQVRGTLIMTAQELLARISDYCRQTGLAESTFGRRAVNDGKLANRLRNGGRITTETVDRIQAFMDANRDAGILRTYHGGPSPAPLIAADGASAGPSNRGTGGLPGAIAVPGTALVSTSSQTPKHFLPAPPDPQRQFRFFDNRP